MVKSLYKKVILHLYPNVQRQTVKDPKTDCKLRGPLFMKTDMRPSSLEQEEVHIKFHKDLEEKEVDIVLGLPKGTKSTQEMNQGFQE